MLRKVWIISAACVAVAAPVHAKNDTVLRGPEPKWVIPSDLLPVPETLSGPLFVRRSDVQIHLDARGQQQYQGYRMKILHSSALQLGNFAISWNPAAGAPTVHALRLYRDGKMTDILKNASFEILRRENQLEAAVLDGVLTAVLRIPDLRVGDEVEAAVTIVANDPTLGAETAGLLMLGADPPPGRHALAVNWDDGQTPLLKMTAEMEAAVKQESHGLRLSFDNPAPRPAPQGAPARFGWQRVVEFSNFRNWSDISRRFAPLYAKAAKLEPSSPLKEEARKIAAAHPGALDRASAALRLVQQEVRYVYVGLNGGNLAPASPTETWQRRYGDCKGKTALLLALLSELGIAADPVMVSNSGNDDGLDEHLPNPVFFDHVLVRAAIGGKSYWLDGTLPAVAGPTLDPVLPYRWLMPLTAAGSSIVRIDWKIPETPTEVALYEIDAREGFDRPSKVTTTQITRGIEGLKQQIQFSALTPAQLLSSFRQESAGNAWVTVDDVKWHYDSEARASILTVVGTRDIDWEDEGGGAKSLILPGGGFNPPERRGRASDQDQSLPYANEPGFSCHVTTVRLPKTTRPENWSFNSGFKTRLFGRNYYRAFGFRDGAITMIRGSRVDVPEIDPVAAARDNGRIAAFDNSMAVIRYEPKGQNAVPSTRSVPTTTEIDWSGEHLPCLSSAG
ncbi:DUF3857 domain-containing protein [Sphingomonas piscis]|uniref:DUF3857 domain-containing protein n=1 Tax=Sphingomonas piscis TaxID=2714943 RepID=UPI003CCDB851